MQVSVAGVSSVCPLYGCRPVFVQRTVEVRWASAICSLWDTRECIDGEGKNALKGRVRLWQMVGSKAGEGF